jgi:hypothetical protein
MLRISVDFPAPFGPSNPKQAPGAISKDTLATAATAPKRFTAPSTRSGTELF